MIVTKQQWSYTACLILILAICLSSLATATFGVDDRPPGTAPPPDDARGSERAAAEAEMAKLQGEWVCTHLEFGGQSFSPETWSGKDNPLFEPVIRDNTWVDLGKKDGDRRPFYGVMVNPSSTPKTIDLSRKDPEEELPGIYKIEGDVLTICLNVDKDSHLRPTRFATRLGDPIMLLVYERKKPPQPPGP